MKNNEPFNPEIKSSALPENVHFGPALNEHINSIVSMMFERNPLDDVEEILKRTQREIKLNLEDPDYKLYVATIKGQVVGLCRFYHSRSLPEAKKKFPAPEGWFAMGTLVSKEYRRKNLAHFLFEERIKILKKLAANCLYSMVDVENITSIRMHERFGFKEIGRARGFLHLDFGNNDRAILYRYDIT